MPWSSVQANPFDGQLVYDKHFDDHFTFVSVWSLSGIRATYTRSWRELIGHTTIWRTRTIHDASGRTYQERLRTLEPIYQNRSEIRPIKALLFAIAGQQYRYETGPVSADLANALRHAPDQPMLIRVIWTDDSVWDAPIGLGTVKAWRQVFALPPP
ncbi:MAG: hypothetical protein HC919_09495 [Oscillatoriales cyanobacterium SM2_2_1]|nr:hypothetical protein [Oscillatoriales cyanobacterium SM2_2_1]